MRSTRPLPLPANLEGSSTQQQGSLEDRSSDGSLDIASIPPPVLAQDDSLEGVGEADAEEELARPRPQPPPPPRTLSRISEGSFSRQMGSSGEDKPLAAVQSRFFSAFSTTLYTRKILVCHSSRDSSQPRSEFIAFGGLRDVRAKAPQTPRNRQTSSEQESCSQIRKGGKRRKTLSTFQSPEQMTKR